jgi:hypothetical protein
VLAVELGISPNELLDAPDGVLEAIVAYLELRNKQREN